MADLNRYQLIEHAIKRKHPLLIRYGSYHRAVCPYAIGTKDGIPVVLVYQFGGGGPQGVVTRDHGQWLCMPMSEITDIESQPGDWCEGDPKTRPEGWANVVLEEVRRDGD